MFKSRIQATRGLAIDLAAFIIPPFLLATYLAATSLTTSMVIRNPEPLTGEMPSPWVPPSQKPVAVIVASNAGTQITDLLGPFEILQASGLFRVVVAAPVRQLAPLTGALAILPDLELTNAPQPDLIFVPAIVDPNQVAISTWLQKNAPGAKLIVGACEGARVLGQAGLLQQGRATSHVLALKDLRSKHPGVEFVENERVVVDGKILTSAGVTGAIDAAFRAVEIFSDATAAERLRKDFGWKTPASRPGALPPVDFGRIALDSVFATFQSARRWIGVLIYPGVSELSLALTLDALPRAMHNRAFSIAAHRTTIKTRFGLHVVPTASVAEASLPDLLLVPSGLRPDGAPSVIDPMGEPLIDSWVRAKNLSIKSWLTEPPGTTLDRALALIAQLDGPRAARSTARLMEYPHGEESDRPGDGDRDRSRLMIAALLYFGVGSFSVFVVRWIRRRIRPSTPAPVA